MIAALVVAVPLVVLLRPSATAAADGGVAVSKHTYRCCRHDSLVVFDVSATGELSGPLAHVPTGKHPRNFNIDPTGRWLLVGNAHDDTVVGYAICPETGVPVPTGGTLSVPTPTRILFSPPQRLTITASVAKVVAQKSEKALAGRAVASAATVVHSNGTIVRVVRSASS
eukprot:SAG31_NODE_1442_length_8325_cov_5.564916_8_plen_169_part_00